MGLGHSPSRARPIWPPGWPSTSEPPGAPARTQPLLHAHHLHRVAGGRRYLHLAGKALKLKLNRASDCLSMLRKVPGLLQEQHRGAALGLRENTAFARDSVHARAGDPVYTPHLVSSMPQSNRNREVPCEDTSPPEPQGPPARTRRSCRRLPRAPVQPARKSALMNAC